MPKVKQTVIVNKSVARTLKKALKKAKPHTDRVYTSRETQQSFRFRQRPPKDFYPESFITVQAEPGVSVVLGDLRKEKRKKKKK